MLNIQPVLVDIQDLLHQLNLLLMIIIGATGWTGIARLIRAEMLRIKNLEYIQAATVLGFPSWRIIFKQINF